MLRRIAAVLLAVLTAAGIGIGASAAFAATPTPTPTPTATASPVLTAAAAGAKTGPSATEARYLKRVLVLVNRARSTARTCGTKRMKAVAPLTRATKIDRLADRYAGLMASKNFFSHTSPSGVTMSKRMDRAGLHGWVGEDIAAGYPSPASVVQGWLASTGHCTNIMRPQFTRIGLGLARSAKSTYRVYWVLDFSS